MNWVVIVGAAWLVLAVTGAVVIGRSIRLAERQEVGAAAARARRPLRAAQAAGGYTGSPRGPRRASTSRAVSACLAPVDRSPTSWENETT